MIEVKNLIKSFGERITVLKGLSFDVAPGTWTSLTGPSGSGKTTLLSILAGLEAPSSGLVKVDGNDITRMSEEARARFRAEHLGFIFQTFRLMPTLTALENVCVPLEILGRHKELSHARELLDVVGLGNRAQNLPSELSGGEQQRVAIARAFVTRPRILFADEPTGNLDSQNGKVILELMQKLQRDNGSTLVVVTHDANVAAYGGQQLRMKDGSLEFAQ